MAAPKTRTMGDSLRVAADQLYELAERADTPSPRTIDVQILHDAIETVAGNVRATVRGRPF